MRRLSGFTLIELITVIVVGGIVATMAAAFMRGPIQGYFDANRRAELVDQAELALRRMQRDIRRALPNSVRVTTAGGNLQVLEMVNTLDGVSYRKNTRTDGTGDPLLLTTVDSSFEVLGSFQNLPANFVSGGERLVIYNLGPFGLVDTDVYVGASAPGSSNITPAATTFSIATAVGAPFEDVVTLSAPYQFAEDSPRSRLYVIDTPITYICDTSAKTLTRYQDYAITATQPTSAAAMTGETSALVALNISACNFAYDPGSQTRKGQFTASLSVTKDGETVSLLHQVHVDNSP